MQHACSQRIACMKRESNGRVCNVYETALARQTRSETRVAGRERYICRLHSVAHVFGASVTASWMGSTTANAADPCDMYARSAATNKTASIAALKRITKRHEPPPVRTEEFKGLTQQRRAHWNGVVLVLINCAHHTHVLARRSHAIACAACKLVHEIKQSNAMSTRTSIQPRSGLAVVSRLLLNAWICAWLLQKQPRRYVSRPRCLNPEVVLNCARARSMHQLGAC